MDNISIKKVLSGIRLTIISLGVISIFFFITKVNSPRHAIPVQALTRGVINVQNYGAVGDGVTDDTAAFTAAMASASASTDRKVYIPAGTYLISGTSGARFQFFDTAKGMEVYGDGMGKSIIKYSDAAALTANVQIFRLWGPYQSIHDLSITVAPNISGNGSIEAIAISTGSIHAHIYNTEISGIYGSATAGGAGITLYQPWDTKDVNTTLGTSVGSGSQTVTPASMINIYVGKRLSIGGSAEFVVVTSRTDKTFTANFANSHAANDAVTGTAFGNQFALIENNYIHDSYKASAIIVNSSSNVFRNNKIISVGSDSRQHGFYIQGGNNVFDSNYVEGVSGYSFHGHKQVSRIDGSGDRYVNNTSVNPGATHIIVNTLISDGGNPDIPAGAQLTRSAVIIGNHFKTTKDNVAQVSGISISGLPATISNNIFEDATSKIWISSNTAPNTTISNNIFKFFALTSTQWVIYAGNYATITGNEVIDFKGQNVIQAGVNSVISGNIITMSGSNNVAFNLANNTVLSDNVVTASGGAVLRFATSGTGIDVHDNNFSQSGYYITNMQDKSLSATIHDNTWTGGMFRFDTGSKNLQFYNNDGYMSYAGYGNNVKVTRMMGQLLYFPKDTSSFKSGYLVKASSGKLTNLTTADKFFLGISFSSSGSQASDMYIAGQPGTEFDGVQVDGPWSAGNIGVVSSIQAGKIHDTGSGIPTASGSAVLFLDSGSAAGAAQVKVLRTL